MALVLTCCPPGPEAREKRQASSDSGTENESRTRICSGMRPIIPARPGSCRLVFRAPGAAACGGGPAPLREDAAEDGGRAAGDTATRRHGDTAV
ncbi:hypothetical protein GCM10022416_49610 [Actinomadura keratinilytica]|uniref:Uncharacterized protein n=1 Tax=Actinomadura keratinilytica TaxID=547461 RepID=A0ABP7ZAV4_9ACTN